jgi:hypothetical protein
MKKFSLIKDKALSSIKCVIDGIIVGFRYRYIKYIKIQRYTKITAKIAISMDTENGGQETRGFLDLVSQCLTTH